MCGADGLSSSTSLCGWGSSPRVRGRRCPVCPWCRATGLIPACAGQTCRGGGPGLHAWAHPRVCGADGLVGEVLAERAGSSPRVRGRHTHRHHGRGHAGLIPACAGQTPEIWAGQNRAWAHPRVCGADNYRDQAGTVHPGSSPRVRGRLNAHPKHWWTSRLIPACAGQTRRFRGRLRVRWAHPRVCGADESSCHRFALPHGSSPRVRGRLSHGASFAPTGGSSPRVRGRLVQRYSVVVVWGLIPACAGQTAWRRI